MAFYLHSEINKPKEFIQYLEDEEDKKFKSKPVFLEHDYALNICKQNEKKLIKESNDVSMRIDTYRKG